MDYIKSYKKESPFLNVMGMGGGISSLLTLASGEITYVDDVFSTYLYTGTGSTQTITNGIDLSGEGGLVWIKTRTNSTNSITNNHYLQDSERSNFDASLASNNSNSQNAFDRIDVGSNGFTTVISNLHESGINYASWTFRKAPGFFDVVTYTGDGTNGRDISHNLGSAPGMIVYKALSSVGGDGSGDDWWVDHRSLPSTKSLRLNTGVAEQSNKTYWTESKRFDADALNVNGNVNQSGINYVAYIFAHDDQSFGANGDEAIIKCGSYSGTGSAGNDINVGFEPQFIIAKNTTSTNEWFMYDSMRIDENGDQKRLNPSTSGAELTTADPGMKFNATGFTPIQNNNNKSGQTFIYIAIRRPHKPPESGTDVFAMDTGNSSSTIPAYDSNFPVDFAISRIVTGGGVPHFTSRLTGTGYLRSDNNFAESTDADYTWDSNVGWGKNWYSDYQSWMFRRAPGFMDVVTYTGNGTAGRTVAHNLASTPEFIIAKNRSITEDWTCYHSTLGATKYIQLNGTSGEATLATIWNNTAPTSTNFTVGTQNRVNGNTYNYLAYLFATLPGISKVGSYTGTGSNIGVDCGFTAGARFVMIKRTDSTGDWYVWDSARGIVSGDDPYLLMNSTAAEVTNTDYIDPLNSGFTITSSAPAALNASGGNYIFLAIA